MRVINFHTHIYPSPIAQKATEAIGNFYTLPMNKIGTSEQLLEECRNAGIEKCVIHSVATTPHQVPSINSFVIDECRAHDEFYGFAAMHPDFTDFEAEIERITRAGLKGIKIHPDTQRFDMDDERMFPIYEAISGKLPILIHCGDYRYGYSHPKKLARVLDLFPRLTVIGAHFGGWTMHDLALEYLKDRSCFLDISSSFALTGVKRAEELIKIYGAERMLFGTDFPMWDARTELDSFMSMKLTDEERELILHKNAEGILNI